MEGPAAARVWLRSQNLLVPGRALLQKLPEAPRFGRPHHQEGQLNL